ncbi:response regulator transcription factor [Leucobacter albus]|uniref:Response regulator transcription factor n=1 Tax=Leucobacter albus TaxID=272210 RepID=A0ABW3TRS0_9MICO
MPHTHSSEQLRLIRAAVAAFAGETKFPVAFGGYERDGIINVSAFTGTNGSSLHGLRVANNRGLGGRAMSEHRARFTSDYLASTHFSHDYDKEIGGEGIVMLIAVPVVVEGDTRAMLYGGTRGEAPPDESFMRAAAGVTEDLAHEIRRADAPLELPAGGSATQLPGPALQQLRRSHAEVRRIAAETTDPVARERLAELENRLLGIEHPERARATVRLTARELDVLSHAALGATNAQIGLALGIAGSTVKSYLKTAMGKLQTSTRHAAVAAARQQGLIV